ncbi:MAG: hypothetical protein JXA58_05620, partial [Dehalococcoidia bacterium]|nr:hypothetical protein [Dehalococcoidia bacterium]
MTVRAKAVTLVVGALVVSLVAIHLVSHVVLIPSYASLETRFVHDDVLRMMRTIDARLDTLDATCHDWASWDDMYEFMGTQSSDFSSSNLVDSSFLTLG